MKIAFVTPQFIVGGAETYIVKKAEWLISHGYEVIVISQGGDYISYLPATVRHFIVEGISLMPYVHSPLKLHKLIQQLVSIFKENKVDVIEAHNTAPILYVSMSYYAHRQPYFLNVLLETAYDRNTELRILTKLLSRKGLFYTLTADMRTYIEQKCGSALVCNILPIPVTNNNRIPTSVSKPYLLSVARLSEDKMFLKYVIEGFYYYIVKSNHSIIKYLYIVGDGPFRDIIQNLAIKVNGKVGYEAVVLKGTVIGADLDTLYQECMGFVGVGTSLLIAASYQKACILASIFMDLQDSSYGYWGMHPLLDCESLTGDYKYYKYKMPFCKAIEMIALDEKFRNTVGRQAFNLFAQRYDSEKVMNDWSAEYKFIFSKSFNNLLAIYGFGLLLLNILSHPLYRLKSKK